MSTELRQIAMNATPEEIALFERVKAYHARKSNADMIRFLIVQEAAKILPKISPIGEKKGGRQTA